MCSCCRNFFSTISYTNKCWLLKKYNTQIHTSSQQLMKNSVLSDSVNMSLSEHTSQEQIPQAALLSLYVFVSSTTCCAHALVLCLWTAPWRRALPSTPQAGHARVFGDPAHRDPIFSILSFSYSLPDSVPGDVVSAVYVTLSHSRRLHFS